MAPGTVKKSLLWKYDMKSKKPDLGGSNSVSATWNVGWKANKDAWIRPGDYMTDTIRCKDRRQETRLQDRYYFGSILARVR